MLAGKHCCHRPGAPLAPHPDNFGGFSVLCVSNRDAIWSYCLISAIAFSYQHGLHLLNEANCFTAKDGCTGN